MLHRPMSRALSVGVACLGLASVPAPVPAYDSFETVYVPTTSVVGTSMNLLPTAYIVPTAFSTAYLPTSYISTSAMLASESVVYPTSTTVVRRSLFRPRRYVERSYYSYPLTTAAYVSPTSYVATSSLLPTTYVTGSSLLPTTYITGSSLLPTTYISGSYVSPTSYVIDNGVVATSASSSSYPCETTTTVPTRATASRPANANSGDSGNTITSVPSNGGRSNERPPQGMINSGPGADDVTSSAVKPGEVPDPVKTTPGKTETPPGAPLPEPDPSNIKVPDPGKSGGVGPQAGETTYRSARRPGSYDGRNILRGRVISADTRRTEEGVTIIVSNATKNFNDRQTMTDADGEFKVSLPDGDWTVKVKMPSGSVYQVGRDYVTASNGRVTDSSGKNVSEFLITR